MAKFKWSGLSRKWKITWIVIAVIVILAAASSGSSNNQNKSDTAAPSKISTNQPKTTAQNTSTQPQEKAAFDDGTLVVGKDVQPGTYRTHGTDGSNFGCYWARLSGFGGTVDEIIANNGSYDKGPQVVTIASTDKGFETRGCGKWYSNLSQVTASKTTFTSGIFIVGTDIDPGTYKSTGAKDSTSCYWARLSGFGGSLDEIIANNVSGNTVATISATDKGFSSTGCGTWTLSQ